MDVGRLWGVGEGSLEVAPAVYLVTMSRSRSLYCLASVQHTHTHTHTRFANTRHHDAVDDLESQMIPAETVKTA